MRTHLNRDQEFQILHSVFDKVLWVGFIFMSIGLYKMLESTVVSDGIFFLVTGVVILFILTWVLIKEFHFGK